MATISFALARLSPQRSRQVITYAGVNAEDAWQTSKEGDKAKSWRVTK